MGKITTAKNIPESCPKAIDLFSGCGGLTQGLKLAKFKVIAAIEIDKRARETFKLNHPEVWLAGEDIRAVNPIQMMNKLGLSPGELDLLAGCPPCQGFSSIRKGNKNDERNLLIDEFAKFTIILKPKLVMMENVPNLANYYRFKKFLRTLHKNGYKVRYEILNVADYGVPQRRKRLILSASRIGEPLLAKPKNKKLTVRDTIKDLPTAGSSGDLLHDLPESRSNRVCELIRAIPINGGSRNALPDTLTLNCHKKSNGFRDVYGRMSWDEVAPTLTGGCSNPSKGRFLHPEEHRAITLREAALLQGFPINYLFDVTHGKQAIGLMIGNALPPPFIAAHAKAMARNLSKI